MSQPFSCERAFSALPDAGPARRAFALLSERMRAEYGMLPRDDSQFAYNFCIGAVPDNMDVVLDEMATMQWLCNNTEYQPLCELALRKVADRARQLYGIKDWKRVWHAVRMHTPDILKMRLVQQLGGVPELRITA